jgi:hypothetical protein
MVFLSVAKKAGRVKCPHFLIIYKDKQLCEIKEVCKEEK